MQENTGGSLPVEVCVVLLRHAESEGNAGKIMQGSGEYPLSTRGITQAENAAPGVRALRPDLVVASDLSRAVDTARIAAGRVDHVDPRFRERSAGSWEGRPRSEMESAYPGSLEDDSLRPPDFEPGDVVVERMRLGVLDLLQVGGVVVVFTHGAVLRLLDTAMGGTGDRFGHLDGLRVGADLRHLGRISLLSGGAR